MQRGHQSFGVGIIRLHPLKNSTKLSKICENEMEKERTRVVCSMDVKQMNMGSVVDESG